MKKIYFFFVFCCLLATTGVNAQSPCSHHSNAVAHSRGVEEVSSPGNTAREAQYDVKFYFLDLNLLKDVSTISGNVLIRANTVATTMDTFSVELAPVFIIDSVETRLNSGVITTATVIAHPGNDVLIDLPFTANANDIVEVRIYYHGTAGFSTANPSGDGFFLGGGPSFSASPPYNSSTWWPCKQNLADKADSSWFFITTDTSAQGISNGVLTNVVNVSATKKRWEWKSSYPINFYLIAFVVGTYNKNVQYFHPAERTDSMPVEFYGVEVDSTMDILQKFSDKFGLYPFYKEKYALASVYLGGGMENQTLSLIGPLGTVIEHETMHQWFGDNVSMGSFRDLALSEGFARWAEVLYPELISGTPNATRIAGLNPFETEALKYANGSVYNHGNDTSSITGLYTGQGYAMYYDKAAMIINSLRFEIDNDSLFFAGLKNYQTQLAGGTATGNNLRDVMETTTDMPLGDFFDQWYYGYGYPSFGIKYNHKNKQQLIVQLSQTGSSVNTPVFKTSIEMNVKRLNSVGIATDTIVRVFLSEGIDTFVIAMGDSVTGFAVDPNQWIVNKTTFIARDLSLNVPTAIEPVLAEDKTFEVFPNPTSNYLNIRSHIPGNGLVQADLYNMVGQKVQSARVYPSQPINIAGLPDGLYMLQLNGTHNFKVQIAH